MRNPMKSVFRFCTTLLVGFLFLQNGSAHAQGQTQAPNTTATLPLTEVLRLYKADQQKGEPKESKPPVAGSVSKLELTGRLLEGAVDVTAHVELSVLSTDDWVTVRLLRKDAATRITRLPVVKDGVFSVAGGYLCFITDKPGIYAFDLGFLTAAQQNGGRRKADIVYPDAALAVLKVRFDEHLFTLVNPDSIEEGDGYTLYPQGNGFAVQWQRNAPASVPSKVANHRPPVEPIISAAHASVVSTLEGRRIARLLYELRCEGAHNLSFTIPPRQNIEKVFLNGASIPFRMAERTVTLAVTPARAGDDTARVEMVLSEDQGGYALSGRLDFSIPAASWNVNDLYVTLSLPQVYNYRWEGGSLAPVETAPETDYTQRIPTPGKPMHLHQQLLSTAATVRVAYTVDLSGSYYRAEASPNHGLLPSGVRSE